MCVVLDGLWTSSAQSIALSDRDETIIILATCYSTDGEPQEQAPCNALRPKWCADVKGWFLVETGVLNVSLEVLLRVRWGQCGTLARLRQQRAVLVVKTSKTHPRATFSVDNRNPEPRIPGFDP